MSTFELSAANLHISTQVRAAQVHVHLPLR